MIEFFSGLVAVLMWLSFGLAGISQEIYLRFLDNNSAPIKEPGFVFSFKQAESLGLEPRQVFLEVLRDLKPRYLRVIAYWDRIEKKDNEFDFSELDFQMQELQKRGVQTTLIVGEKTPRWPECHYPDWFLKIKEDEQKQEQVLAYIEEVIKRYRNYSNLELWQLENEPFLAFGECPGLNEDFLKRKLALLKTLDQRPVIITTSGELDTWGRAFLYGDKIGFSVYRRFFFAHTGFNYPLPARFYKIKYNFWNLFFKKEAMVTEFQMEPWLSQNPTQVGLEDQFREFGFEDFKKYLNYARSLDFPRVYFWGVEWWYWLNNNSHPEFLNYLKANLIDD